MTSLNALRMFKQGADEEKAEVARLSSFVGAMAIGDLVKSTLGPKVVLISTPMSDTYICIWHALIWQ